MLTQEITSEMIEEWKKVWGKYREILKPNRKNGQEIIDFLKSEYSLTELHDKKTLDVIAGNVLENECWAEKLLQNEKPSPKAFVVNNTGRGQALYKEKEQDGIFRGTDIIIGVDLASGFYCVEGSSFLSDELCAYQGLDEKDMQNFYCAAQYIACLERFGLLEKVLNET